LLCNLGGVFCFPFLRKFDSFYGFSPRSNAIRFASFSATIAGVLRVISRREGFYLCFSPFRLFIGNGISYSVVSLSGKFSSRWLPACPLRRECFAPGVMRCARPHCPHPKASDRPNRSAHCYDRVYRACLSYSLVIFLSERRWKVIGNRDLISDPDIHQVAGHARCRGDIWIGCGKRCSVSMMVNVSSVIPRRLHTSRADSSSGWEAVDRAGADWVALGVVLLFVVRPISVSPVPAQAFSRYTLQVLIMMLNEYI